MGERMIGRRGLLRAGALLVAPPALAAEAATLPVPSGDALGFRLVRHGSDIGRHLLGFTRQGDQLIVRISVDALVTFASIPIVRYTHRGVETWQGATLVALAGNTDRNGERNWMTATRTAEGLEIHSSKFARAVAPADTTGITYWNRHMLDGPMVSLEDGVLARPKITPRGPERVQLASGAAVPAEAYNLKGTFDVDVAYDMSQTWASLSFTAVDGSEIRYERL